MAGLGKQVDLITELINQTKTGRLRWEKTSVLGGYIVSFPDMTIRILGRADPISGRYNLGVFDGSGNAMVVIDSNVLAAYTHDEALAKMQVDAQLDELYHEIRRVAEEEDQDKVIDNVLTNLRQRGSAGARAS